MHITLLSVVQSIKKGEGKEKKAAPASLGFSAASVRNAELQLIFSLLRTKQMRFMSQEAVANRTIIKIYVKNMCAEITIRGDFCKLSSWFTSDVSPAVLLQSPLWPTARTHILSVRLEVSEHEPSNHKSESWQQIEVFVVVTGGQRPQSSPWSVYGWAATSVTSIHPGCKKKNKKETGRARSCVSLYRHLTCSSTLILPGTSRVCTGETERMGSWICILVPSRSSGDLSCNQCDWKPLLSWLSCIFD